MKECAPNLNHWRTTFTSLAIMTMRTLVILIIVACNCSGSTCRVKTSCVSLRECSHYTSFLETMEKPLKPSVVSFLRAQQCGFADGFPKVCCSPIPKGLKIFNSPTSGTNKMSPDGSRQTPSFDITVSTAPPMASAVPYLNLKDKKIHDFNLAFQDILDFDLFRRRRSDLNVPGVEIR